MQNIKGFKLLRRLASTSSGNKASPPSHGKSDSGVSDLVQLFGRDDLNIEDIWTREVNLGRGMVEDFSIPLAQCEAKACKLEVRVLDGRPQVSVSVSLMLGKGDREEEHDVSEIVKLVEDVDIGARDGHILSEYFHAPPSMGAAELIIRINPSPLFGKVKVQVRLQAVSEDETAMNTTSSLHGTTPSMPITPTSPSRSRDSAPDNAEHIMGAVSLPSSVTTSPNWAKKRPPKPSVSAEWPKGTHSPLVSPRLAGKDKRGGLGASPEATGRGMNIFAQMYNFRSRAGSLHNEEALQDLKGETDDEDDASCAADEAEFAHPPSVHRSSSITSRVWNLGRGQKSQPPQAAKANQDDDDANRFAATNGKPKRRLWDFGKRKSDAKDVSGGDQGGDSGVVTLWSAKEKATATARHFIVDITGPGRYRLVLATLSPKWMVNRTLGFVATVKAHSLLDNVTLEMGSPEFLQNVSYFVVKADDCPAQIHISIWSHSIIKATPMSCCVESLHGAALEGVQQQAWFVPSTEGGEREVGGMVGGDFHTDEELTVEEVQANARPHFDAFHVLVMLIVIIASWLHQLACIPLFSVPVYNPFLPWFGSWIYVAVSTRELLFLAALLWCDLNREAVTEQLVTWHHDYNNYRRVKNLNSRAKDLTNRMNKKGIWGKLKLMRSEYMRTVHVLRKPETGNEEGDDSGLQSAAADNHAFSDELMRAVS